MTTGISAADRAHHDPHRDRATTRSRTDIARPGHVFPLRARAGGVLRRAGQTEGSVDLARLAGLTPAGVICEIMNDDGTMARMPDLDRFARRARRCKIVTHRRPDPVPAAQREARAARRRVATLPTRAGGEFRCIVYENDIDHIDHMALVKGEIRPDDAGARARAQRVPDRRRLRLAALRLRRAARGRAAR